MTPSQPSGTDLSARPSSNIASTSYLNGSQEVLCRSETESANKTAEAPGPSSSASNSATSNMTAGPVTLPVPSSSKVMTDGVGTGSSLTSAFSNFFGFGQKKPQKSLTNSLTNSRNASCDQLKGPGDVKVEQLKESDILIALMGPTGSGKSSFLSAIAGEDKGIGHGLSSQTSGVHAVRIHVPKNGMNLVLVDTPGFDDTHKSDYEILEIISDWLKKTGSKNIYLSRVLYLHRISDNRMAGTPLKNLELFERICGPRWFNRVVLVTTMWDELDEQDIGIVRERELKDTFWKPMIDRGSTTQRHDGTVDSAWDIIHHVLENSKSQQRPQLQKETVEQGKALPRTDAGYELYAQMEDLDKKRKDLMHTLHQQMNKPGVDQEVVRLLDAQRKELERSRQEAKEDLSKLKVAAPQRFFKSWGMKTRYFGMS